MDDKSECVPVCKAKGIEFLGKAVEELGELCVPFGDVSFDSFFRSKGVDYAGEEVKVAQYFCWESIEVRSGS